MQNLANTSEYGFPVVWCKSICQLLRKRPRLEAKSSFLFKLILALFWRSFLVEFYLILQPFRNTVPTNNTYSQAAESIEFNKTGHEIGSYFNNGIGTLSQDLVQKNNKSNNPQWLNFRNFHGIHLIFWKEMLGECQAQIWRLLSNGTPSPPAPQQYIIDN